MEQMFFIVLMSTKWIQKSFLAKFRSSANNLIVLYGISLMLDFQRKAMDQVFNGKKVFMRNIFLL